MVAFATASAAASDTASAEWHVPAGDAGASCCPSNVRDGRLVVPEIGGETGEAAAQHMGRDVSRQIAQHGDSGTCRRVTAPAIRRQDVGASERDRLVKSEFPNLTAPTSPIWFDARVVGVDCVGEISPAVVGLAAS